MEALALAEKRGKGGGVPAHCPDCSWEFRNPKNSLPTSPAALLASAAVVALNTSSGDSNLHPKLQRLMKNRFVPQERAR